MSGLVYHAINAVAAELATSGIPKCRRNEEGDYAYRGIEDVLAALAPLLAQHKLCVLPRVLQREASRGGSQCADQLVVVRVAFDLVSAIDGSTHVIESFGEAIDASDKGTPKAMSAAYKAAMLQAFCIPVPQEHGDACSPKLNGHGPSPSSVSVTEPPEGWDGWSAEVIDIARSCESSEALDRLLSRRRRQLTALQRARPELYIKVGDAIAARLTDIQTPSAAASERNRKHRRTKYLKEEATDDQRTPAEAA